MIYNGPNTGIRIHVNGDVKTDNGRSSSSKGVSSGHVVIGRRYVETDKANCSTMMDELMLWNRSLTSEEAEYLITLY